MIGISSTVLYDRGSVAYPRVAVARTYVGSLEKCGAASVVLPIVGKELIKEQLAPLTGLILSGGEDVDTKYYGEEHQEGMEVPNLERDDYEQGILNTALSRNLPILFICRGVQLYNVYTGGNLYQDARYLRELSGEERFKNREDGLPLPEEIFGTRGRLLKHNQGGNFSAATHRVFIKRDSFLYEILKKDSVWVNSFHHQFLKKIGTGLEVTAWASDGAVEAVEPKNKSIFRLGVQWHPEMMSYGGDEEMLKIFHRFVKACKNRA